MHGQHPQVHRRRVPAASTSWSTATCSTRRGRRLPAGLRAGPACRSCSPGPRARARPRCCRAAPPSSTRACGSSSPRRSSRPTSRCPTWRSMQTRAGPAGPARGRPAPPRRRASSAWRPTSPSSARSATARRCRCCSRSRRASRASPPSTPARPARRSPGCASSASSPTRRRAAPCRALNSAGQRGHRPRRALRPHARRPAGHRDRSPSRTCRRPDATALHRPPSCSAATGTDAARCAGPGQVPVAAPAARCSSDAGLDLRDRCSTATATSRPHLGGGSVTARSLLGARPPAYGVLPACTRRAGARLARALRPARPGPTGAATPRPARDTGSRDWLAQAGLDGVRPAEFAAVVGVLVRARRGRRLRLFGGALPRARRSALFAGHASRRRATGSRRRPRRAVAQEAWPRMIEEIRILTGVARPLDPPGAVRGRPPGARRAAAGVRGGAARVAALHRLRPHRRRAQGTAWPTPPPTPPARRCSSPTRSAAPTSTAGWRAGRGPASRTCRAARTPGPSRPASASPAGSCSSCRSAWPLAGLSIGDGRAAYRHARRPARRRARRSASSCVCWVWAGRSCASPRRSGCSTDDPRSSLAVGPRRCGPARRCSCSASCAGSPGRRSPTGSAPTPPGGLAPARRSGLLSLESFRDVVGPLAAARRRAARPPLRRQRGASPSAWPRIHSPLDATAFRVRQLGWAVAALRRRCACSAARRRRPGRRSASCSSLGAPAARVPRPRAAGRVAVEPLAAPAVPRAARRHRAARPCCSSAGLLARRRARTGWPTRGHGRLRPRPPPGRAAGSARA